MSSFFRPASEISASEDISATSLDDDSVSNKSAIRHGELAAHHSVSTGDIQDLQVNYPQNTGPSIASHHYQSVLVHALLEEKCLHDVCQELNAASPGIPQRYTVEDPQVIAKAIQRYRALTGQLSSHGLVSTGLEGDDFRHVRQTARDGLSLLSQQLNALDLSTEGDPATQNDRQLTRQPLRRLLTESSGFSSGPALRLLDEKLPRGEPPLGLTSQLLPSHPLLDSTRYGRDFDEVCMLGKGGYGSVYQCNHRLDGRSYAVKKIILGPTVLSRVQQRGQGELNDILGELRTMARLEHPNIVRYFGGWIEWSRTNNLNQDASFNAPRLITQGDTESAPSAQSWSSQSRSFPSMRFEASGAVSRDCGVVFESSTSPPSSSSSVQEIVRHTAAPTHELHRTRTKSTLATVTDENDVEEISRRPSATEPSVTASEAPQSGGNGLSLTLHIQMSLYPLTLSHYLASSTIILDSSELTLRHCFHLPPSVAILTSVLDGVQHLHAHGIVHRDLKPANIFLKPSISNPTFASAGSVDPLACHDCDRETGAPDSASAQSKAQRLRIGVCVGDFGLVSVLPPEDASPPASSSALATDPSADPTGGVDAPPPPIRLRQVGTELYRPPHPHPASLRSGQPHFSQDIYALGIVFVELLCRFDTRMERQDVLGRLRQGGKLPGSFERGERMRAAGRVVRMMLGATAEGGEMGCEEVRGCLADLVGGGRGEDQTSQG